MVRVIPLFRPLSISTSQCFDNFFPVLRKISPQFRRVETWGCRNYGRLAVSTIVETLGCRNKGIKLFPAVSTAYMLSKQRRYLYPWYKKLRSQKTKTRYFDNCRNTGMSKHWVVETKGCSLVVTTGCREGFTRLVRTRDWRTRRFIKLA